MIRRWETAMCRDHRFVSLPTLTLHTLSIFFFSPQVAQIFTGLMKACLFVTGLCFYHPRTLTFTGAICLSCSQDALCGILILSMLEQFHFSQWQNFSDLPFSPVSQTPIMYSCWLLGLRGFFCLCFFTPGVLSVAAGRKMTLDPVSNPRA